MAPTVAHFVWLPAPRGGRCACGPAKPVPRPLLVWEGVAPNASPLSPFVLSLSKDALQEAIGVCGLARPVLQPRFEQVVIDT